MPLLAVPTRLFALQHGATLVWGPEIVDKAILHSTREVDRTWPYQHICLQNADAFCLVCVYTWFCHG